MRTSLKIFGFSALFALGCASAPKPAKDKPQAGPRADAEPAKPETAPNKAASELHPVYHMMLPVGWDRGRMNSPDPDESPPALMLVRENPDALIMAYVFQDGSVEKVTAMVERNMRMNGVALKDLPADADKPRAPRFLVETEPEAGVRVMGRICIFSISEKPQMVAVFLGRWSAENDGAMVEEFELITSTFGVKFK